MKSIVLVNYSTKFTVASEYNLMQTMIVYLDYFIIENFLITLLLLLECEIFLNIKYRNILKIASALFSAVYSLIMLIINIGTIEYVLCKILLLFILVYIAFKPINLKVYLKQVFVYMCISSINIGAVVAMENIFELDITKYKVLIYFLGFSLSFLFIKYFWKTYKNNIMKGSLIKNVELYVNGKTYKYKGFLDTGNTAFSYEFGVPVLFAEYLSSDQKEELENLPSEEIDIRTISDTTKQKIYYFKYAKISDKNTSVAVSFIDEKIEKNGRYNMILNYLLFEKLGGISL